MDDDHRTYLDHAATTPMDGRVVEAMVRYLQVSWGNPSSIYFEGREARKALDGARRTVAGLPGPGPNGIVFTGGGSENPRRATPCVAFAEQARERNGTTSAIEHHAERTAS